jgi:hypothetical protein
LWWVAEAAVVVAAMLAMLVVALAVVFAVVWRHSMRNDHCYHDISSDLCFARRLLVNTVLSHWLHQYSSESFPVLVADSSILRQVNFSAITVLLANQKPRTTNQETPRNNNQSNTRLLKTTHLQVFKKKKKARL